MSMRRTGHIRERSPGSWELRYSLGTDPATGSRRIATTTVKGKRKAAEKELRRLLRTLDTGEHVDPSRMTVREWLTTWLAAVREEVSPISHERYSEIVDNFLVPELGAVAITKLVPSHIQTAYSKWAIEGRRDGKSGGLSPRTRRHIHRILSSALARAVGQQVLARNPADAFKKRLPKVERKEMATLTVEQSARLLDAIAHSRVYWPTLIALATGMRRGEILALRWRNVDLDRGSLRVMESLEQTRQQAEELLKLGVRQTSDTLVCGRADGQPHSPLSLTYEFARFVGRMKELPRLRFHDLRHSHATQLLASGVHPKIAQERLGHSTISTTLDLYSHVSDTMQTDAAARLDAVFQSAKKGGR
jgi:integrase